MKCFLLCLLFTLVFGCRKKEMLPPKSSEKQIKSFVFSTLNPVVNATIDQSGKTILANLRAGTPITQLAPTISVSNGATCTPASGVPQNFSRPVVYTVTAQDGSTQTYTVTITAAAKYLDLVKVVNSFAPYDANSWEQQHPVYETPDMQIFMVCIWVAPVNRVSVYRFNSSFNPLQSAYILGGAAWVAYRESFNVLNVPVPVATSAAYTQAFKQVFDKITTLLPAQHYGIKYSGHGVASGGLFEGKISAADTRDLLAYVNGLLGKKIDFLDWNTNCNGATYTILKNQAPYTDYLVASDLLRGGYNMDVNEYFTFQHEQKMHTFFAPWKSMRTSLVDMVNSERNFWASPITRGYMTSGKVMQSISIFDAGKFQPLMSAANITASSSGDALLYIQQNRSSAEALFNEFRFHYISNKDFFTWPQNTNGFSLN